MAIDTTIKAGYKQTELGLIPVDWDVIKLGEIGNSIIGLTYSPNDVVSDGKLVHRSSNIQNNKLSYEDNVYVSKPIVDKLILRENDIMICVRNGSRDLIGKSALIRGKSVGETFGAFMSIFRSDEYQPFIFHLILSNIVLYQINQSLGATINQITNKTLNSFQIPYPKKIEERKTIATVLCDTDNLIEHLEKLIDKKRAIKQGTMQQLLTGKKRLPGFSGEWEYCNFEDIWQKKYPKSKICSGDGNSQGDFILFISGQENKWIDFTMYKETTALIFSDGGTFNVRYFNGNFSVTDHCVVLNLNQNNIFYYFWLTLNQKNLDLQTFKGSGLRNLNVNELAKVLVPKPPTGEQTAIATILSDMDSEIDGLEKKRDKYVMIKQGMMQQLLTGKIRLYAN